VQIAAPSGKHVEAQSDGSATVAGSEWLGGGRSRRSIATTTNTVKDLAGPPRG
jgi:hypothetical protein